MLNLPATDYSIAIYEIMAVFYLSLIRSSITGFPALNISFIRYLLLITCYLTTVIFYRLELVIDFFHTGR